MITKRDKLIINYMSEYKYATIKQLEKIFFREQQYSYNIARRRMNVLVASGYVRTYKEENSNKIIYILNDKNEKINPPNAHRLLVLDVLAEMYYLGMDVKEFIMEKEWMDGKVRSDAFAVCDIQDRRYRFFVEVHISNNKHNLEKYSKLYDSGEVQEYINSNTYPRVLLVTDRNYKDLNDIENINVVKINTELEEFIKSFL